MRRSLWIVWALWLSASWLAPTANAFADDVSEPDGYRAIVDDALREYAAQHYEEARALFHRANELFPNARTHRGLGMAQFELRNYGESIRELEEALASTVRPLPPPLREETETLLARARNFVALVTLLTTPASARLRIDGVPVTLRDGAPLVLNVGDRELELSAPGYVPARRTLSLHGGERATVAVQLEPAGQGRETGAIRSDRGERERRWYQNPWLWTGVAVVAGGAVVAGVLLRRDPSTGSPYGGTTGVVVVGR